MSNRPQKLVPARLKDAEQVQHHFHVVPERDTPYERVLERDYWAHVAAKIKPSNLIQVEAEDGSYWALLLVRGVSHTEVSVVPVLEKRFDSAPKMDAPDSEYKSKWNGPHDKYIVYRVSDNEKMQTGFDSPEDADLWIANHKKAMAA